MASPKSCRVPLARVRRCRAGDGGGLCRRGSRIAHNFLHSRGLRRDRILRHGVPLHPCPTRAMGSRSVCLSDDSVPRLALTSLCGSVGSFADLSLRRTDHPVRHGPAKSSPTTTWRSSADEPTRPCPWAGNTCVCPNGIWRELKVAPDEWEFTFSSLKERERSAPEGSGLPPGTQYHWYILAHRRVRKIDKDAFMQGVKHSIAHRRPHWKRWSSGYPDQPSEMERLITILGSALSKLRDPATTERPIDVADPSARPVSLVDIKEGHPLEG